MKLTQIMNQNLSYCDPQLKKDFHREGKKALKAVALWLGLEPSEFDLRSNKAGIAVSGEITLHTNQLYIQLSQPCCGRGTEVLYRRCDGRRDYTGKQNWFTPVRELEEPELFVKRYLRPLLRRNP